MSSFKRRNSDWQAYGQHRRRAQTYHNLYRPTNKADKLQQAIKEIKQQHGNEAVMTGAEYEQKISDGHLAD